MSRVDESFEFKFLISYQVAHYYSFRSLDCTLSSRESDSVKLVFFEYKRKHWRGIQVNNLRINTKVENNSLRKL